MGAGVADVGQRSGDRARGDRQAAARPAQRDPAIASMLLAEDRERRIAEVRADLGVGQRGLFDRAVRATALFAAEREATKAAFVRALEPSRRALAELARRDRPRPRRPVHGHDRRAPRLLADPSAFSAQIDERRRRRDLLQAGVPPFWFEGQLAPPETWPRRTAEAAPDDSPRELHGMGVCPGTASGFARVVIDPADPYLGPDDVLVAPITDPAWTPLFLAVAAVVVDVGAQQSHAAIVARELGIPAVVSVTAPHAPSSTAPGSPSTVTAASSPCMDGPTAESPTAEARRTSDRRTRRIGASRRGTGRTPMHRGVPDEQLRRRPPVLPLVVVVAGCAVG